jgi:hypothetical protein
MTMPQSVRPASAPAPERLSRYTACLLGAALGMAPLPARWPTFDVRPGSGGLNLDQESGNPAWRD